MKPDTASTLLGARDQFMTRADTTIRFRVIGNRNGPPVVLLHGYSDRVEMWRKLADSLASSYRVIVPDIRGFGMSTRFGVTKAYGNAMVTDVVALLDSLNVRTAHVVGYSLGALMTARLAAIAPERVRSATLVAGSFMADSAMLADSVAPHLRALERGKGLLSFMQWILPTWPEAQLREISVQILAVNDLKALVASLRGIPALAPDWRAVAGTGVPALVIVGRADPLLSYSRDMARRWPAAAYTELDGNDHAVIADAPELVRDFRKLAERVETPTRIAARP